MAIRYQRGNQNPYIEDEQTTQWPKVWRYQRGNQNPYIEEEQTTQCILTLNSSFIYYIISWMQNKLIISSAGFTNMLDRLKTTASEFRGLLAKVYSAFDINIGLSYLCCHSTLCFLNNLSVIFLTQLHSISEYWRILKAPRHPRFYSNWINTIPSSSGSVDGGLGGT
jgi:hypothetical protein